MKYIYSILILALASVCTSLYADKVTSYLPGIGISGKEVVKKNREVELKMSIDLSDVKMRTQHTVTLIPVIVSKDGGREAAFPPVVIDGRTRSKIYMRARRLESVDLPPYHDGSALAVIRRQNRKPLGYDYTASVPYERWMLDGRIDIREYVYGCVNCGEGESEKPLPGSVLPVFVPDYRLDTIAPRPEPVKVRAENRTAWLQFRQDSYEILPGYKDNRSELDSVSNSISMVKDNEDVTITGIYITGYASPEGTVAHNLLLSENRARALADYISRHDAIDRSMLHVDWKGEDWDGFRLVLDRFPGLLKRDEVWSIIDGCTGDRDKCEQLLKQIEPSDVYRRLLDEVYPYLRRNEYKIEYNVRNFNLEEARTMLKERPDLLSLTEMYRVAASYDDDSPEYSAVMRTAAEYFPEEPAVLNALALESIEAGDYARAISVLESAAAVSVHPILMNTLGVAYAKQGELSKAESAFLKASEAGDEQASHNLSEVRGVIEQL